MLKVARFEFGQYLLIECMYVVSIITDKLSIRVVCRVILLC